MDNNNPPSSSEKTLIRFGIITGILPLFCFISWFPKKTGLMIFLYGIQRGLLGAGMYVLPLVLLCLSSFLLFKKPSVWIRRFIFISFLPIAFGALVFLFRYPEELLINDRIAGLWTHAVSDKLPGGVLSGCLGIALRFVLSTAGAAIILILLMVGSLFAILGIKPVQLIMDVRKGKPEPDKHEVKDTHRPLTLEDLQSQCADLEEKSCHEEKTEETEISEDFDSVTDKIQMSQDLDEGDRSLDLDTDRVKQEMQEFDSDQYIKEPEESDSLSFDNQEETEEEKSPEGPLDTDPCVPPNNPPQENALQEEAETLPEEESIFEKALEEEKTEIRSELQTAPVKETPSYEFPPVDFLQSANSKGNGSGRNNDEYLENLKETLNSFGVEPNIVAVLKGPAVTRYELKLAPGIRLSRITGLTDDIALALGASGIRIAAIPEKPSVVGIEIPNARPDIVTLREVVDSDEFEKSRSEISFAVGKDTGGNSIIGNIKKFPHLLIAGGVASGKTVFINCIVTSLLYKAAPEDVKLIIIDPNLLAFDVYNGIPHLMLPVISDPKKASGALQWAVSEMQRRYYLIAECGTRDLESYNRLIEGNPERKKIPQLVIIIGELVDLMMADAKEVEDSICRLAHMGHTVGIHLVIATQQASSDVITGPIKTNIPSRIAFAVSSPVESRTILDASGAENLMGRGDMLYAPLGEGKAKRIQGCYVSDEEILKIVTFVKASSGVCYDKDIEKDIEEKRGKQEGYAFAREMDEGGSDGERDELIFDAVDVFMEIGQASVSVLQRQLKTGYARSARIVDQMEEMGIVGPSRGSKPRDLLISKEKWQEVKDGLVELE